MRWRKGFTMVELAIVIVIVTIMASVAIPRWIGSLSTTRVETAAKQVATAMRFSRQMAVTARQSMRLVTAPGWQKLSVVNVATNDTICHYSLPGGSRVISLTGMPTFAPRGTSTGATIVVGDENRAKDVIVNVVSRIRVEDHTP